MEPLQDPYRQIRLLRLLPGEHNEAIMLEMTVHDFDPLGASGSIRKYLAISYTWGESESPRAVYVDGESRIVRRNCHYALWQARLHYAGSYIWIDSICIDQENLSEKSQQVAIMGAIFGEAAKVLACVGFAADDSDYMFKFSFKFTKGHFDTDNDVEELEASRSGSELRAFSDACESFIARPYWERLWILQELMMAKSKRILCGERKMGFSIMSNMCILSERDSARGCLGGFWRIRHRSAFGIVEGLLHTSRDRWRRIDDWLEHLGRFKCTDVRDRVYGVLNIFSWNADTGLVMVPDYGKSVFSLAEEVIRAWAPSSAAQIRYLLSNLTVYMDDDHIKDHVIRRRLPEMPSYGSVKDAGYTLEITCTRLRDDGRGRLTCCFEQPNPAEAQRLVSLIDETIAKSARREGTYQYVYSGNTIIAVVNADVRVGDFFAELHTWMDCCLILRHSSDQTFEIIGQAIKIEDSGVFLSQQQCLCTANGIMHDIQRRHFSTTLSIEDVVVLLAQDMSGPDASQIDPVARVQRLRTRVSLQDHPMARIVDEPVHQDSG